MKSCPCPCPELMDRGMIAYINHFLTTPEGLLRMEVLVVDDLSKSFATKPDALNKVSFSIESGVIQGIVGPNGSGKTTLISCILGMMSPSEGTVNWKNGSSGDVFFIPDRNILPELLTGQEYISFLSKLYGRVPKRYTDSIIDLFEMNSKMSKPISDYSFGMKKKIQIIAGCSISPRLMVLDEPFRGLDIESIIISKNLLKQYARNGGAVLLSSHDIFLIEQLCDSIMMLYSGEVKAKGQPAELLKQFSSNDLEEVFMRLTERDIEKDVEEILSYQ